MTTPRCTVRGCPVRWRDGTNRPCAEHAAEDAGLRGQAETMAELMNAPRVEAVAVRVSETTAKAGTPDGQP